jgi:hypothetical protein
MEILDAINRLDDHVHTAPEIPLTDSVRIEASLLQASVGVIRQHADRMWGSVRPRRPHAHGRARGRRHGLNH